MPKKDSTKQNVMKYIKERFTKEKVSSYGGLILVVLATAGIIPGVHLSVIQQVGTLLGYDLTVNSDMIGLVAGLVSILAPTSKMTQQSGATSNVK